MDRSIFKPVITVILALCALCSCEKEIRFTGQYDGEKLVLYSCANPEAPLSVMLYKSRFILSTDDNDSVREMKSGATVTGEASGHEIIFTENRDLPGEYCSDYIPKEGETIILRAHLKGLPDVEATATVPRKVHAGISNCRIERKEENSGETYTVNMRITIDDPAGEENFYRLSLFQYEETGDGLLLPFWTSLYTRDVLFFNATGGLDVIEDALDARNYVRTESMFEDSAIDGESYSFDVWFNYYRYQEDEDGGFDPSMYIVELDSVSRDLYLYDRSCEAANGGELLELFGEPVSIHNNVKGGIGCFGAITTSILHLPETKQAAGIPAAL